MAHCLTVTVRLLKTAPLSAPKTKRKHLTKILDADAESAMPMPALSNAARSQIFRETPYVYAWIPPKDGQASQTNAKAPPGRVQPRSQSDQTARAMFGKQFQQTGMGNAPIYDDDGPGAAFQCFEGGLCFGDHAAGDDPFGRQAANIV